jgi:hypothetical protein
MLCVWSAIERRWNARIYTCKHTYMYTLAFIYSYMVHSVTYLPQTTHYTLLTTHYSLHTTLYTLPTTHFSLHTTHYSLHTPHFPLPTTHFPLLTTHYILHTTHFSTLLTHTPGREVDAGNGSISRIFEHRLRCFLLLFASEHAEVPQTHLCMGICIYVKWVYEYVCVIINMCSRECWVRIRVFLSCKRAFINTYTCTQPYTH